VAAEHWLDAVWPVVHGLLPSAPARVLELGCGPLGGFVPRLRSTGYDALGIDPKAPEGDDYRQVAFEDAEPGVADALVASLSLHHVADPALVVERIAGSLVPGGTVVVVEWDWEALDDGSAQWAFERLPDDGEPGWLHRRRDEWAASGESWEVFFRGWAEGHGLHPAGTLVRALDARFDRTHAAVGPYLFVELDATEEDERAAVEAGLIRPARVDYAGTLRRA